MFYADETPDGKFMVKVDMPPGSVVVNGSWNVLCARAMGLSYANYLRYCRDVYGAELVGVGSRYPKAYFTDEQGANDLADELEERWRKIEERMDNEL